MKFIHCADIHLDSGMRANLDREKSKERKAEILRTFLRMVDYAEEQKISVILIAGDLFDTNKVSKTAMNAVYNCICTHPDVDFYYLKGNHDVNSFLASMEEIPKNLHLFTTEWTSYQIGKTDKGNIMLYGAEFDKQDNSSLYNRLTLNSRDFNIVTLHGQTNKYQSKDKVEVIPVSELRNKGIDYLAMGHIHSYSMEKLDDRGSMCYPGCLEGRGFDECGEHGFVVIDVEEETGHFSHSFVSIAARRIYAPLVDVSGCKNSDEMVAFIKDKLREENIPAKSLVKIVLQGDVDVECDKNIPYIRSHFVDDFYFVKVDDETKCKVDYLVYEHDASLKGEFIRTVMASGELTEEEKVKVIRCGILALAGEEFAL